MTSGGLGVLASLRDLFFFFSQSLPAVTGRIDLPAEVGAKKLWSVKKIPLAPLVRGSRLTGTSKI
jgi:hypothetical protein